MDELNIERTALVGNSCGGDVALRVAVVVPERIAALGWCPLVRRAWNPSTELQAAWEAEESALERGDVDAAVGAALDAWLLCADAPRALHERGAAMQRHAFEVPCGGRPVDRAAGPHRGTSRSARRARDPALVAAGELDMPDFRFGADALTRQLPHPRRIVISRAGHLAPLEQPEAFRDLLIGFLREAATHDTPAT